MKKYVTILIMLCLAMSAKAQWFNNNPVQKFEGEIRYGLNWPLKSRAPEFGKTDGWDFSGELRYNFQQKPFDVGLELGIYEMAYDAKVSESNPAYIPGYSKDVVSILAISEYNFKRGTRFNPFAGIGIGVGFMGDNGCHTYVDENGVSHLIGIDQSYNQAMFTIRAGVELIHHIRLTLQSNITGHGYSNFSVSIGGVIGGRPKNKK